MKLSIVTTLYNSRSHLEEFYERMTKAVSEITNDYEIIFVNDGSPDNSLEKVVSFHEHDERVVVIDLSRNFGHHKAMMTGLTYACGNLIFLIDSDLEESPDLLKIFYDKMMSSDEDIDVVFGIQSERKGRFFEKFSGSLFYKMYNLLSNVQIPKNIITARLMSKRYVSALVDHKDQAIFIAGLWQITGFNQVPMPVKKLYRRVTSYDLLRKLSILVNAITSFSTKPLRFIFYLGILITLVSFAYIFYLVIQKIVFGVGLAGWPSLIISIWLLGGLTIFSVGIVGIYLSKIFIEVKPRPYSIIRTVYRRSDK
jgi:putative glycosyltransferase